jgi:hypothetical protein
MFKVDSLQACFRRVMSGVAVVFLGGLGYVPSALAQSESVKLEPSVGSVEASRWRLADAIVTESKVADRAGWLSLDCEGSLATCQALLDAVRQNPKSSFLGLAGNRVQVDADDWLKTQVMHLGPLRAATGLNLSLGPWLDAAFSKLRCSWQDSDGNHQLDLTGGPVADYKAPNGVTSQLTLERTQACSRCAAMDYIRVSMKNMSQPEQGTLDLHWNIFGVARDGYGKMSGYAGWPTRQPVAMQCIAQ